MSSPTAPDKGSASSRSVSRKARFFDVASIVLVLAGGACYAWAFVAMQSLGEMAHDPNAPLFAGYRRYARLLVVSRVALGTIALGVMVGVGAALYARRRALAHDV